MQEPKVDISHGIIVFTEAVSSAPMKSFISKVQTA